MPIVHRVGSYVDIRSAIDISQYQKAISVNRNIGKCHINASLILLASTDNASIYACLMAMQD